MKLPEGVTKRQVHYWIKQGYLEAEGEPGRGHPLKLNSTNQRKAVLMARLRELGFEAPLAARVAEQVVWDDPVDTLTSYFDVGPGVDLTIDIQLLEGLT